MNASNAVVFEGATADAHETTLTTIDATGDRTISLPNVSGTIPVLAAVSATAITSTPAELNILDGATVVVGEINALDLGDTAVGKTCLSNRLVNNTFYEFQEPTIGAAFLSYKIEKNDYKIKLDMWDTAGQERY